MPNSRLQRGKGNIYNIIAGGNFHQVTPLDIYAGLELGLYDDNAIQLLKAEYTAEQWLRIYMLVFTEAKNFIWESYLNTCIESGFRLGWDGIDYHRGGQYDPQGVVYCGFDCGHSGEAKRRSVYRMDILEYVGSRALWLNGFEWDPTIDPERLKLEIMDIWQYYKISAGYADALKANFIATVNDGLYERGLIRVDRSKHPKNSPADWQKWSFAPVWNTGRFKYLSASETKKMIEHDRLYLPYYAQQDDRPIAQNLRQLLRCLLNIREVTNKSTWPTLEIIKPSIGDDAFDAINMATLCANDRQIARVDFSNIGAAGGTLQTATEMGSGSMLEELTATGTDANFNDF